MIAYEEALKIVLKNITTLEAEEKSLLKCTGQVLAEEIYSDYRLPQTDISGPDGYAVRSADIRGAGRNKPATLRIIGTVRAGQVPVRTLKPGTAMRIMTGAIVPQGADCVVRFEDTDEPENKSGPNTANPVEVKIFVSLPPRSNIRPAGSNIEKGAHLLSKGAVLGPTQISALAAVGKNRVRVVRQPVVAVIATGDELIGLGKTLSPGKTYNCNTAAIVSFIKHYGGIPRVLGIARDKKDALLAKIEKGMTADLIITSGGVAKGDYDLLRLVMDGIGKVFFSKIKMGPGASVAFGMIHENCQNGKGGLPVFCLAGPPFGCLINLETLVRPALLRMQGQQPIDHPVMKATASDSSESMIPFTFLKWTRLEDKNGQCQVGLNMQEKMGVLRAMATANSLTMVPGGAKIRQGDLVLVLPLDWRRSQFSLGVPE